MGDQNNRPVVVVELPQQSHNGFPGAAVEVAGGFIGQDKCWIVDQRPGDGHPLPLPAGQFGWFMVDPFCQTHPRQRLLTLGAGSACRDAAAVKQGQQHVFQSGQAGQQIKCLKDKADFPVAHHRPLSLAELADEPAVEPIITGGGGI